MTVPPNQFPGDPYVNSQPPFTDPLDGAMDPSDLTRPYYGASFGIAVRRFLSKYASFSGRASRSEFWWAYLFQFLVSIPPFIVFMIGVIAVSSPSSSVDPADDLSILHMAKQPGGRPILVGYGLMILISLALLLPNLGITWRRLHDANLRGLWWLISFIPFLGDIALIVFEVLGSNPAGRRFDKHAAPGTGGPQPVQTY